MPLLDQIREKKLIELAKTRFDPNLKPAELKVLHDSASSKELPEPDEDALRPDISPDFIRWLATDQEAAPHIDPKGLRVYDATIPSDLDLRGCHVHPTLDFSRCTFKRKIDLRSAEIQGLFFSDSSLAGGMSADRVVVHGPLFLRPVVSEGEIRMPGARIRGNLDCGGAKLRASGTALNVDRAQIGGSVFLKDDFESEGEIRLLGAEITGQLNCLGAKLRAKGDALIADGAKIGGDVFLKDGFESEGTIRLLGARIEGDLDSTGAKLKAEGNALSADGAKIVGAVFLKDGFESEGEIRLLGTEITGQLNCTGAKLKAKGDALSADGAKIGSSVFLMDGFESKGEIRLHGAEIRADLTVFGAKVTEFTCLNTVVKGDLIWQRIEKSEKTLLNLAGARVKNLRDDKKSWPDEGKLNIDGLVYEELTHHAPSSEKNVKDHTYPRELPLDARERIAWILLQRDDRSIEPQPWMQLRDLLERKGDRKGAKYVLFRFRCLQARKSWFPWRWFSEAFAWLEENPLRIAYSILFALTLGTLVFAGAVRSGAMIETVQTQPAMIATYVESAKGSARKPDESNKPVSIHYTSFQPFIYTLENAVPLVKLGMDERWMPDLQHQPQPWCSIGWLDWLKWFNSYGFLVWFRWLLIVWGWAQATILAASLADRFKK